tara:strand:+ start:34 stop:453 length:420 start_codon:yes stop_codon:yes gene_type:complete
LGWIREVNLVFFDPVHHHKVPFIPMDDQGKLCLFHAVIIKFCPYGLILWLHRLAQFKQVASGAGGFRIFPYLLQGDQFAVVLGNDAQAGRATIFGIWLFIERESGFQLCNIKRSGFVFLKNKTSMVNKEFVDCHFLTIW